MGEREEVRLVEQAAIVTKSDAGMANPDVFSNAFDLRKDRDAAPSIFPPRAGCRGCCGPRRGRRGLAPRIDLHRNILLSSSRTEVLSRVLEIDPTNRSVAIECDLHSPTTYAPFVGQAS